MVLFLLYFLLIFSETCLYTSLFTFMKTCLISGSMYSVENRERIENRDMLKSRALAVQIHIKPGLI